MKRRNFLTTAGATLAAAAGTATVAAALTPAEPATLADPDVPFLHLWRDYVAARAALADNAARWKAAMAGLPEWAQDGLPLWSEEELCAINMHHAGGPRRLSLEAVKTFNHHYEQDLTRRHASPAILAIARRENAHRLAAFADKRAARDRIIEAAGIPAIEKEGDALLERTDALEEEITRRPAHGPLGVYVKLRLLADMSERFVVEPRHVAPILDDLRHITGLGHLDAPAST